MRGGHWRRWARFVLAAFGSGVGVLAAVGLVPALGWPYDLASPFLPQSAALLAGVALVFLGRRRRREAAAFACLAAVPLAVLAPYLLPKPAPATGGRPIRILLSNVHVGNRRPDLVCDLAARTDADIVVLLELPPEWRDAELADIVRTRPATARTPVFPNGGFGMGLWSRLPQRRPAAVEDLAGTGRPSIIAELDGPDGRPITLVATHPLPPMRADWARSRDSQLAAVGRRAAAAATRAGGRVVVVGDLNAVPWSAAVRGLAATAGLRDTSLDRGLHPSWPTNLPPALRVPIDQCLATPDLRAVRKGTPSGVGSDHLPLLVELAPVSE